MDFSQVDIDSSLNPQIIGGQQLNGGIRQVMAQQPQQIRQPSNDAVTINTNDQNGGM